MQQAAAITIAVVTRRSALCTPNAGVHAWTRAMSPEKSSVVRSLACRPIPVPSTAARMGLLRRDLPCQKIDASASETPPHTHTSTRQVLNKCTIPTHVLHSAPSIPRTLAHNNDSSMQCLTKPMFDKATATQTYCCGNRCLCRPLKEPQGVQATCLLYQYHERLSDSACLWKGQKPETSQATDAHPNPRQSKL
jgi:hypothetical protein